MTLSVDAENPLSRAITNSLKVEVPAGLTGQVGFSNAGYLGVPVNADSMLVFQLSLVWIMFSCLVEFSSILVRQTMSASASTSVRMHTYLHLRSPT